MKKIIPDNMERSAFRRGEYVAWIPDGSCVRVTRGGEGWRVGGRVSDHAFVSATGITARTLVELGEKLAR